MLVTLASIIIGSLIVYTIGYLISGDFYWFMDEDYHA